MKVNYNELYKEQIQMNLQELRKIFDQQLQTLNVDEYDEKITNWAKRYGYEKSEVINHISFDEMFACNFIKDPSRQNIYEIIASHYINSLDIVNKFKKLSSWGKNAKYIDNGVICIGKDKKGAKNTKSIDFEWYTGKYLIYATHKYTNQEWGSQDNQYKDVISFLEQCQGCESDTINGKDVSVFFLAICDGSYYQRKERKSGQKKESRSRIEYMQSVKCGNNRWVLSIEELEDFLKDLLKVSGVSYIK